MTRTDRAWIKSMELFAKYWGCHQLPERSFFIGGYQLPVCAQCTGIILGDIVALFSAQFSIHPLIGILLMLPLVVDGSVQFKTRYRSTNVRRLITGTLFGFGMVSIIIFIVHTVLR